MVTRRRLVIAGLAGLILPPALLLPRRTSAARLLSRGSSGGGGASYDVSTRIAGLRAHAGFGSFLTANHDDFPAADGGLQLPGAPIGPFTTRNVSTLEDVQTYMSTTGDPQDVILAAGDYGDGNITISSGAHNKLTMTGCTGIGDIYVNGGSSCHHLLFDGGSCKKFHAWHATTFATDLHWKNITAVTDNPDTADTTWRVHRNLIEHCLVDQAGGGLAFISEPGCTNLLQMNSRFRAAKTAAGEHENAIRSMGGHLYFTIDCSAEIYYNGGSGDTKYCWRSHSGDTTDGGCNGVINTQFERGGLLAGDAGTDNEYIENSQLVLVDVTVQEPAGTTAGRGFDIRNDSPAGLTTNCYALRCHYHSDEQPPETAITTIAPPGTEIDCVYKDYDSTPPWDFHTSTPVTAAE